MREDRKVSLKARRKDTLSAEDLGILLQWWYKSNACRRKMATRQERCHGRKAGKGRKLRSSRRELLMPASLWCQHSSSTSKVLSASPPASAKFLVPSPPASANFWCQPSCVSKVLGASPPASAKFLVPTLLCQQSSGASQLLMSAKSWYQPAPGVSKVLVPAKPLCQHWC
jgi:hypothetical protein